MAVIAHAEPARRRHNPLGVRKVVMSKSAACPRDAAIEAGLTFLRQRQKADGSFSVYQSGDFTFRRNCTEPSTSFGAAMIAHCLGHVGGADAQAVIDRAVALFLGEMRSGVCRYWLRTNPWYRNIPPDVDSTSCISAVLEAQGVAFPDNKPILLLNRDREGLFYTWIKPRRRFTLNIKYWGAVLPQILQPVRAALYWRLFSAAPDDRDGLVNANVLMYLGVDELTYPIVDFLCETLARGEEETCDKWYRNALVFYYLTSRALGDSLDGLYDVKATIIERTIARLQAEDGALDLALAVSTLITCGADPPELQAAVRRLLEAQKADGSWAACPFYFDSPKAVGAFGSEELTTGFCLEALARHGKQPRGPAASASRMTA